MSFGTRIVVVASTVAIAGGCGGGRGDANVPTIPIERAATNESASGADAADPWWAFSEVVFSGGRAMLAAIRRKPHDARWDCEGSADADLRATQPGAQTVFQKSGARGEPLIYVLRGFELAWPLKSEGEGRWRSVRADLVVRRDGGVRWRDVTTQSADVDEFMPVAELPPALRGALTALTTQLPTAACALPSPNPGELEALQIPPDAHDETTEMLQGRHCGEASACKELRGATGPFWIRARHLVVALGGANVVTLASQMGASKGRVCLGHVVVR
jgi:hypothetical protein